MKTLVLIPAYNEEKTIHKVISEVKANGFDVLVVDDGSGDNTAKLAHDAGAYVLVHKINRGQGATLKTGIEYAKRSDYEVVAFFDADGQMRADEISKIIAPVISSDCEVALGSRFLGRAINIPLSKKITLKLACLFTRITTGLKLTDTHNGFQAWSVSALKKINLTQDGFAHASELLQEIADKKIKYKEMPVTIVYTIYSKMKGQSVFNAFNIIWDLIIKK